LGVGRSANNSNP